MVDELPIADPWLAKSVGEDFYVNSAVFEIDGKVVGGDGGYGCSEADSCD